MEHRCLEGFQSELDSRYVLEPARAELLPIGYVLTDLSAHLKRCETAACGLA